jgi:hypothetical protein
MTMPDTRISIEETIIDAMIVWRRTGTRCPFEIVLFPRDHERLEQELLFRLGRATALTGDAIIVQGPEGPIRVTKMKENA